MLFWQDGSFLGLATQIGPYTSFRVYANLTCNATAGIDEFWKKTCQWGRRKVKQKCNLWGLCYASCPLLPIVSPGSM